MNSTHTSIIDSLLDSRDFEKFELQNTNLSNGNIYLIIGVNIHSFCKIINTAETIDSVIFEIKSENEDVLNITFENRFRKCNYKLKLLDINCEEIGDIKLDYDLEIDINIRRFMKIVQDIDVVSSENICFNTDVVTNKVFVIGNGDIGQVKILLKKLDDSNMSTPKRFKIKKIDDNGNKTIVFKNIRNECLVNSFNKSLNLEFSLESIKNIFKISQLVDRVLINISEVAPLKLCFKTSKYSFIDYHIAPKIVDFD